MRADMESAAAAAAAQLAVQRIGLASGVESEIVPSSYVDERRRVTGFAVSSFWTAETLL